MTTHQQASAPIGGYYTLSFESNTTIPLSHSASALEVSQLAVITMCTDDSNIQIKSALEALDSVNEVTVGSPQTLTQDYLGTFCPGRKFEIIFENHRGDLPLLDIDSQNLVGSDPLSTVEEVHIMNLACVHNNYVHVWITMMYAGYHWRLVSSSNPRAHVANC